MAERKVNNVDVIANACSVLGVVVIAENREALSLADHVILADIYAARETDTLGMSSESLAEEIKKLGCDAYYLSSFEKIENFVLENCFHNDLLITMGAGDVVNIGDSLLK